MDLVQSKIFAIASIGIGSMFVGLLPACFTNQSRNQWPLFLSCLLCFGGGVLLSTSVVHILPELRENTPPKHRDYVELVFCAGFFVIYLLDEIMHFFYGEAHSPNDNVFEDNNRAVGHECRRHSTSSKHCYGATETQALLKSRQTPSYNPSFLRAHSDSVIFYDEPAPSQLCHVGHQEPCHSPVPTSNIGLLFALSVHSLLEGLVIGLEQLPTKVLLLLGAVASHKLVVGFCLGVELAANAYTTFCRHITCILIFTIGSVAGIFLGIFLTKTNELEQDNIAIPFLQALAGGTLLYVTVSEILPRERARWHQQHEKKSAGIAQFFSVLIGFSIMTVVSRCLDED